MKQINVSVIGLSGIEKDKGQVGVGKSCLCNRFIRPIADEYNIDHISVLSQSDFSGRIVNNDHFLYWGDVRKSTEEGVEYNFQIIEQTEFIDDSTFQPFKVGKMDPYVKRCTTLKVFSAEKLMYICKNQLGIEREYEQKVLPDGRLNIDGFIVVFDVSPVPNRSIEKQVEFVHNVITNILRNKKPLVLVTTKNDDASELYVREAERIIQRKEYKGLVQLVETSAHESINVDLAFLLLAQTIDKVKYKTKIVPYQDAARCRKELLDLRTEAVTRLIRNQITDYHSLWSQSSKLLAQYREWNEFLNIFGQDSGQKIFRRHMKKLRDDNLNKKLYQFMDKFACALQNLLPDISLLKRNCDDEWDCARKYLRSHQDFDQYFIECHQVSWTDIIEMDKNDIQSRIPFDVLETSEAETVFRNYLNSMQQDKKKIGYKQQFKSLLEESGFVTPGKQLSEVRVLFMGRECFEALSEHDCQQIYDIHQDEITEKSKHNFIELLLENAQFFQKFKTIDIITQEDVKNISEALHDDFRYKILDRLDQERKVILFQHLGFIHCPIREHCPFYLNCVDNIIEEILAEKSVSTQKNNFNHEKTLNLLIMGSEHLASDLLNDIRLCTGSKGEYIYEHQTYFLNFCIANGETEAFKSVDIYSSGLICVYSNQQSFETLKDNLEKTLLYNLELEDKFENLPIVIVFQPHELKENEIEFLRGEGIRLSEMLHCEFIDNKDTDQQKCVFEILNIVIISLKLSDMKIFKSSPSYPTDLRILLCMFCGDQYDINNIVNPLIAESTMCKSSEHSIIIDVFIGDSKRRVEFILTSYHSVNQYNDELIHGFIYFYSAKRRSSFVNLKSILSQLSNVTSQIIAITESGGANAFFNNEMCQVLLTEGNALADRCKGNFLTFSQDQYVKFAFYSPFLKNAWENKFEIENQHVDDSIALDSGEGTLEISIHQIPRPPLRNESYNHSMTLVTDGSGSENYELLPTRSLNSLNEEKDLGLDDTYDNNEETCQHKTQKWLDETQINSDPDKSDVRRNFNKTSLWNNFSGSTHAYTTGRRNLDSNLNKFRPKGPSQTLKQPGKLNLKNFQLVSEAVARMNFCGDSYLSEIETDKDTKRYHISVNEDDDNSELAEYEQIGNYFENEDCTESDSCASSTDRKVGHHSAYNNVAKKSQPNKKTKKKKFAIPVQTPRVPLFGSYVSPPEIPLHYQRMATNDKDKLSKAGTNVNSSIVKNEKSDMNLNSPESSHFFSLDQIVDTRQNEKYLKELDKSEKRRLKEENARLKKLQEKEKDNDKKMKRKQKQNSKGLFDFGDKLESSQFGTFMITDKNNIPVFLVKCVEYIEQEGLDSEGIYRVPGSRAHVELLFQKFEEDSHTEIRNLDIPVNAVATALKDFFSKRLPPLFNKDVIKELEEISGPRSILSSKLNVEVKTDRSCRLIALKTLLEKLSALNFVILKYIFQHFVHVSENSKLNSMDSKNLAICWWPTLIPIDFADMGHFEQLRPYLEDIVQTMIDQFPYLFCGKDAFVMV